MASQLPLTFNRTYLLPSTASPPQLTRPLHPRGCPWRRRVQCVLGLRPVHRPVLTLSAPRSPVEVAVHTILYVRHVYPPDLFVRRRKYDTPVYQSRHPALNAYIAGAVKAVAAELALVSAFHPYAVCAAHTAPGDRR